MINFTNREKDVIKRIAEGKTKQEIADELYISYHTVKTTIEHIYEKANVHNKVELIVFLLKNKYQFDLE